MDTSTKEIAPPIYQKSIIYRSNTSISFNEGHCFGLCHQQPQNNSKDGNYDGELFEQKSSSAILQDPFNVIFVSSEALETISVEKKEKKSVDSQNVTTKKSEKNEQILRQNVEQQKEQKNNRFLEQKKGEKIKVDWESYDERKEIRKFQKQKSDYNCQILRATVKKLCLPVSEEGISSGPKNQKSKVHFFKFFKQIGLTINGSREQVERFMNCYEEKKQIKLLEIGKKFSERFVDMIRSECELMQRQIEHMLQTNDFDFIPQQSYLAENSAHPKAKSAYKQCLLGLRKSEKSQITE